MEQERKVLYGIIFGLSLVIGFLLFNHSPTKYNATQDNSGVIVAGLKDSLKKLTEVNENLALGWLPTNHFLSSKDTIEFCGRKYSMKKESIRERVQTEISYFLDHPHFMTIWYLRLGRYFPVMEEQIKNSGKSQDLKFCSLIESGLNPKAVSSAKAVGLWQFIRTTGQRYGLYRSGSFDLRRDPVLATEKAMAHFQKLLELFNGDYLLALAAYNMGEGGLLKRIKEQKTRNYFSLHLPTETEKYVPAMMALKVIYSYPDKYLPGISQIDKFEPLQSSTTVRLKVTESTTWQGLAVLVQMPLEDFQKYNTSLIENPVKRGIYNIRIPIK